MFEQANSIIKKMENCIKNTEPVTAKGKLKVGVDLGTANIVLTVLDADDNPLAGALYPADVVRDGIVVEYLKSVEIVRKLKSRLEEQLGRDLDSAATAIPPGIISGNVKVIKNVVQSAGFEVTNVLDEPEAASKVLGITDGVVVDIGGGTTGISILEDGKVTYSADEATGGRHVTLTIAGSLDIPYEEAEKYKLDESNTDIVRVIVRPVIEKMGNIISNHIRGRNVKYIYLVGGTSCLEGIEGIIENYTGVKTIKPYNPLLVTPMGIAMSAK